VGSLSPWHRVDVLLDALRLLRDHRPQDRRVRLVTVGRGSEEAALRARAHTLSLDELVEWRGALSHDDAVRAMLEFDIAVLPSTLPTGAPMKLSEYAALARPIIAPDQANIRDLFADREEIVLVPPGNPESLAQAIRSLAADPARARGIGQAAQRRVAERTWERAIDVLLRRAFAGEPAARS
jgi:glycosyltransferase involved in cell wall biosynthesis